MTAEYQLKSLERVSTFSSDIPQCHIQILLSTDKSIQCHTLLKIYEITLNIPKPRRTFLLPIAAQRYWITHNLHYEMAETCCHYSRPTFWSNSQLWVQIGIQGFAQNLWQEKYTKIFVLGFHSILKTTRRYQSSRCLVFKRELKRHDSSGWPKYKHNKSNEHGHNSVSPTHKISHSIIFIMNGGD